MDVVRFGLGVRVLRRRRGWSQDRLAAAVGVSRSAIWRVERGHADRVTVMTLGRIVAALDARAEVRLLWHGENLDRLIDARHARLVELTIARLSRYGWLAGTEVSFNVRGERGSIDVLAFHMATRSLLVVEVKSVVPDLQAMLHGIDRKARVASLVARERDWSASTTSRLLILPNDKTSRRRVRMHHVTFDTALPAGPSRSGDGSGIPLVRSAASGLCQMLLTRANVADRWLPMAESGSDAHTGRHLTQIPALALRNARHLLAWRAFDRIRVDWRQTRIETTRGCPAGRAVPVVPGRPEPTPRPP